MENAVLTTIADRHYLEQAKQLFESAYLNGGWNADYLLLVPDHEDIDDAWFRERGIKIYRACMPHNDEEWTQTQSNETLPSVVTLKYRLFDEYLRQWRTVVYLDSDIIVRGNLRPLQNVTAFSAVQPPTLPKIRNQFISRCGTKEQEDQHKRLRMEFDLDSPACNTGVLAFPPSVVPDDVLETLTSNLHDYGKISKFGDQGFINLAFYKNWHALPMSYNVGVGLLARYEVLGRMIDGHVLHFNGAHKPWEVDHPFFPEWRRNLEMAANIDVQTPGEPRQPSVLRTTMTTSTLRLIGKWRETKKSYVYMRNKWNGRK